MVRLESVPLSLSELGQQSPSKAPGPKYIGVGVVDRIEEGTPGIVASRAWDGQEPPGDDSHDDHDEGRDPQTDRQRIDEAVTGRKP